MSRKRTVRNNKLHTRERPTSLKPLTENQDIALEAIECQEIIFLEGAAGTGKTLIATIKACEMLYEGLIEKVVLTRPNVEIGRSLGALPGTKEEKIDPYMSSMRACITSRFSRGWFDTNVRNGNIVLEALSYIQGLTFDKSIIILDEAEHITKREAYIILTRIGIDSKLIMCGDNFQKATSGENGFQDAIRRTKKIDGVQTIRFTSDDIVRSGITKEIVKSYED